MWRQLPAPGRWRGRGLQPRWAQQGRQEGALPQGPQRVLLQAQAQMEGRWPQAATPPLLGIRHSQRMLPAPTERRCTWRMLQGTNNIDSSGGRLHGWW